MTSTANRFFLLALLVACGALLSCREMGAQYDLSSDTTSTLVVAVTEGDSVRYARYRRQIVSTEDMDDLPDGHYFRLEELQSQPDPESDPEPALLLTRLLSRDVHVEEAWYSPPGREPTSGEMVSPGFSSPLILVRLDAEAVAHFDLNIYPVEDPASWLKELRDEYAHYSFVARGMEPR